MKKFIFDLDNTLVYTNFLNNLSYNYALKSMNLPKIHSQSRITRKVISSQYPILTQKEKERLINIKQNFFMTHLEYTTPNLALFRLLLSKEKNSCILWTACEPSRACSILKHYNIEQAFYQIIFSNKACIKKDIKKIMDILNCNFDELVIFEDNKSTLKKLEILSTIFSQLF